MPGRILSNPRLEEEIYNHFSAYAARQDPEAPHNRLPRYGACKGIVQILSNNPPPSIRADDPLVKVVKGFMAVENLLPDYIGRILELVRSSAGRFFHLALWGAEEALHSWALGQWCMHAIDRETNHPILDTYGIIDFYKSVTAQGWDPINHSEAPIDPTTDKSYFADPEYGLAYVILQEKHTSHGYRWLSSYAQRLGQVALAEICKRLEGEEMRHHVFYRQMGSIFMQYYPTEFSFLLRQAHVHFAMPAKYIGGSRESYVDWSTIAQIEGVIPAEPRLQRVLERQEKRDINIPNHFRLARQEARIGCWNQYVSGISRIFIELGIEVPTSLSTATILSLPQTTA